MQQEGTGRNGSRCLIVQDERPTFKPKVTEYPDGWELDYCGNCCNGLSGIERFCPTCGVRIDWTHDPSMVRKI